VTAARGGQMIIFQEQEVLAVMSVGGTDREEGVKREKLDSFHEIKMG
jgi:hypothetical protein